MLITDTLTPEDAALIEREAETALRALYLPIVHEPPPDRFAALLEQLAMQERLGGDPSSVAPM
ncbi:MAG: NepR family anti-sigma factor [Methylocystis sp.]|uniref:NepR family anti-sigma factor n=1 Tax=Methylocystis sp. TaxID=1911079 RepID=UPI003DA5675C